ncbi:MAG: 50S ribosomal protein L9 [Alphaproteobacteria bacterium]|jgi:large subunit ribosomal protein L9|nr:50S ribosomal protein L9 [Alphaproteobacteria bacterium]
MEVILLERIEKLGQMGDLVTVKNGYARNYLLPQAKALRATAANRERFETQRVQLEASNLEARKEAENIAERMEGLSVVMVRQAGDTGQLYGSVNARDIAAGVTEAGFTVGRRQVRLDTVIKTLGLHEARVALHPEVSVTVTVNAARSEEEAKLQAEGIDVTAMDDDVAEDEGDEDLAAVFDEEAQPEVAAEGEGDAGGEEEEPAA